MNLPENSKDIYEKDLRPSDGYFKGFKAYAIKDKEGNEGYLAYSCEKCGSFVAGAPFLAVADMSPSSSIDLTCGRCFKVFDSKWF